MNDNFIEETFALMANATANTALATPTNAGSMNGSRGTIAYPLVAPSYHYGYQKQQQWPFTSASMPSVVPSLAAFPPSMVHSAPSAMPRNFYSNATMPPLRMTSVTSNVSVHDAPIVGGNGAFLNPTAAVTERPLFPARPALVPPPPLARNTSITTSNKKETSKPDDPQEIAATVTAIRKRQFVSFCRWFHEQQTTERPHSGDHEEKVEPLSTPSTAIPVSEHPVTAFVFNAASPNYLVGAYSLESSSSSSSTGCHSWMMEVDVKSGSIRRQWESPGMPKTTSMNVCDLIREIGRGTSHTIESLTVLHKLEDWKEVLQQEGENRSTKVVLLEEVPSWLK